MKKLLFLFAFLIAGQILYAQKNSTITGKLQNTNDEPLVAASAILYFKKDSVLTGFELTDDNGTFLMPNIAPDNYYLQFNFVGYNGVNKDITKEDFTGTVDLGTIQLEANTDLEAVVVTNAPLEVRKDTIVYDAAAFSTRKNASVEDLLKELPGVEVDDDGTITAQGEQVQNVLVDGKKFFGNDPTVATKNLPADAVQNIEVYDKKSEKAEFTGIDDGEEEKTVDIKLKEDRKTGYFGNVEAGGGTEDTYMGKGLVSRFSPTLQLATILSRNNVNDQAFSRRDYFSMNSAMGGGGRQGVAPGWGQDSGINTSTAGGVNVNTMVGDKLEIYGNYFFNQTKTNYEREIDREYFQNEGSSLYDENTNGDNLENNHRGAVDVTFTPNKRNEIKLESSFNFAKGDRSQYLQSETDSFSGEAINDNTTNQSADNENAGLNSTLFFKHRFSKQGRSLFAELSYNTNNTDNRTITESQSMFYRQNREENYHQLLNADQGQNEYRGEISYSEPMGKEGKEKYLELNYRLDNSDQENDQNFYDLDAGEALIDDLSNRFNRDLLNQYAGANYKIIKGDHNLDFGVDFQNADLAGVTSVTNDEIDKNFAGLLPSVSWRYDIKDGNNLRLGLNSWMNLPSVRQLQPSIDNTNPLNIYQGNPNLDNATNYAIDGHYMLFDQFSFTNLFSFFRFSYTDNPITEAQSFDENLVKTSTPINTDYGTNGRMYVSFSKPIRSIRSRIELSSGVNHQTGQIFIDAVENEFTRFNHDYEIEIENTNNDNIDIELEAEFEFNNSRYSENNDRDQSYSTQEYGIDANYRGLENWEFYTDFEYQMFSQEAFAGDNNLPIWRAGLSRTFADNLGEIRLDMYDLLNRNTGIRRSQNLNYTQEEISNALGRYGMVSIRWQIKSGGTNSNNRSDGPPRPPR